MKLRARYDSLRASVQTPAHPDTDYGTSGTDGKRTQ
jgi:hypothetical protein